MRWIGQITYDEVAYFREDVIIEAGNKLGIGTANPSSTLHVNSSSNPEIIISNGGGTSPNPKLTFYRQSGVSASIQYDVANKIVMLQNDYAGDFKFNTGGANEKMRLTSTGQLLVGVTSSANKVHFKDVGAVDFDLNGSDAAMNFNTSWRIGNRASGDSFRISEDINSLGTNVRLMIATGGNVGIGTTSPASKLHVVGGFTRLESSGDKQLQFLGSGKNTFSIEHDTSRIYFYNSTTSSYPLAIMNGGNVGIGTTSPGQKLEVDEGYINVTGAGTSHGYELERDGLDTYRIRHLDGGLTIYNSTDSRKEMTFKGDGNVGIGASSPTQKLHVDGNTLISAERYYYVAGTGGGFGSDSSGNFKIKQNGSDLIFGSGDNVGIGTTSPASKLHVTGTVQVGVDDTGHDVFFYGATSGKYMKWDESEDNLFFPDNTNILFGSGNDATIGVASDNLVIKNDTADKDIILMSDDGSGGVTAYLTLDGSVTRTIFSQEARFTDNVNLKFGSGGDMMMYHDGSNSYIDHTGTGDLLIRQGSDDGDIKLVCDDGSGGLATYLQIDGGSTRTRAFKDINFDDNVKATYGAGSDLKIHHDGSNSLIDNITGHLYIYQKADDKNISFQCDDGSGGNTEYLRFDGTAGHTVASKEIHFLDNVLARFGNGNDMSIQHNANDSLITNNTGDLYIQNTADNKDIIFQSDNGAGGNATYFSLDGSSATHDGSATTALITRFPDNSKIHLGTGDDGRLYHNGTDTYLQNTTGDLIIQNFADDKDIILKSDDGSGGTTAYLTLDGSAARTAVHKNMLFDDSVTLGIGASYDLQLYHNGSTSLISNQNGNLLIRNQADDSDIIFQADDGSGGDTAYLTLDGGLGYMVAQKGIKHEGFSWLSDNKHLFVGSGYDLRIHHNGSDSYISQEGTGSLIIRTTTNDEDIIFQCDDGSGGTATYLTLDGSEGHLTVQKEMNFADGVRATFGARAGGDMAIYHDGTDNYHNHYFGDVIFRNNADDKDIIFQCDDGSGGTTAYLTLDGSAGTIEVAKTINSTAPITSASTITADTYFASSDAAVVLAPASAGTCYLRPNGVGSGTGAFSVSASGKATVSGELEATSLDINGVADISGALTLTTPLATDQQKHLAYFEFKGYGTSDGTNYEMGELMTVSTAPFNHDTSTGSDGLTAQTIQTIMRSGGTVMPYAGVLKKFTGWITSAGSGTVDVGIFKVTPTDDTAGNLTPVLLISERTTASGNATPNSFSQTEFGVTFEAGDIIYSAVKGGTASKAWYFTSTLEVEWA